ncbi:MAG: potassium/proton antiporter [Bacteroidales bacterium]|jgi:cell volume regulation protein A|nr:potassium/proton antiporter [Bacteroidales bacterium]
MPVSIESVLFVAAILFFISLFASKASNRFGVPVLLLFLGIGMLFGSDGLGIIWFENFKMAQTVGTVALCIILFSGGLDTQYDDIKPVVKQGVILATLGVLLTAFITGFFIFYIANVWFTNVDLTFLEALLLASVMSSTDSASVFSILRGKGVRLKNNLKPMLELESGSNDPMAYMLTVVLIQLITSEQTGGDVSYGGAVLSFILQFSIGAIAGYLFGRGAVWLINKINLNNDSLYPILLFTCGIFIFSATYFLKGNGYLAVYIAGLIIGNSRIVQKRSSMRFFDGLAWISQIVMFLTLGLLVNPKELWYVAMASILIALFMIFASRPLSVFISLLPFRKMAVRDKLFVSWVGLRGAVPIIFAIYPLAAGLDDNRFMFNVVFFITLLSLLLQGTSLTKVADWLKVSVKGRDRSKFENFDVEFSEDIKSTMTEIELNDQILANHDHLMDLPLPENTLVVMVKRENKYFIPKGNTELLPEDKLLIITNKEEDLLEIYENLGIDYRLRRT